jgi:protein TonB
VAEGVEGAVKGVEEMAVTEGVMTENLADTPVIYPGCSGGTNEEIRACSKEKFIAFLKSEFNKDLGREAGLDPGDHEISTVVHVDEVGKVSALRVKTSNYKLEGEMKRLIAALPQMTPATKAGEAVPVTFILPVDFKIE